MCAWVKEEILALTGNNLCIAVFGHGMAIKCLLRGIMDFDNGLTYKIRLDNTSITRLKYDKNGWHIECVNDAAHLLGTEL